MKAPAFLDPPSFFEGRPPRSLVRAAKEECSICRQDASVEPIIQPCACRGSMSGVHASCVEAWIAHQARASRRPRHRAIADNAEAPKCSVCKQPYSGTARSPGPLRYARHLLGSTASTNFYISGIMVMSTAYYWVAASAHCLLLGRGRDEHCLLLPLWARVMILAVVGTLQLYAALVLTASLPHGRLAPGGCLRLFRTADRRRIAERIMDVFVIVVTSGLGCMFGHLKWPYFLPLLVLTMMPVGAMLLWALRARTSRSVAAAAAIILTSPVILLVHLGRLVARYPRALADPTRPPLHLLVLLTVVPLALLPESV